MAKRMDERLQAAAAHELENMEELYAEGGARLLGCRDDSGSDTGTGDDDRRRNNRRNNRRENCQDLLSPLGIDIGDTVVLVTTGGTIFSGVLVAVEQRRVRILTTLGNGVPANTLLSVDCTDIAAVGETLATVTTVPGVPGA